ncbi:DNA alkylation repair protein [Brevibacillus dissolubilis]|uniref:DNA alkylation repair protein n=1 Tax=Brevibacillus dissolubilis TaxID=1844116 RepID=UPI001116C9B2|nr:DNA alkylation repair protein [Brevibacillus dissolubilis]
MQVRQIIAQLEQWADPRSVEVWKRLGLSTREEYVYHGVAITRLKQLAKQLGNSHELSFQLWHSKVRDAMMLATLLDEPSKVTREQLESQVYDLDFWDVSDKFCSELAVKTPYSRELISLWLTSDDEIVRRCAYMMIKDEAKKVQGAGHLAFFLPHLRLIRETIHQEQNWVKEGMLYALIAIGSINLVLNQLAVRVAREIGKVKVEYGESPCEAPDALRHLTSERLQAKLKQ